MSSKPLSVAWSMDLPPVLPVSWKLIHPEPVSDGDKADLSLEARLGWPVGSLGMLRQALTQRLARSLGWEVASDHAFASAIRQAARFYKRGVGFRHVDASYATTPLKGLYQIHFMAEATKPASFVEPSDFTVIDGHVAEAWKLSPPERSSLVLTLNEHTKTLDAVAQILDRWRSSQMAMTWTVIGGGLLSDVVAFAASLAQASIRFVPTTLLAMADACVGGKTGVNVSPYGKNQVGAFYFPRTVEVWTGWLVSLAERELRAGGVECLKHAYLSGDLALAAKIASGVQRRDLALLTALMPQIISFKTKVVAEDPGEAARRATLNFGHTLGHALEGLSQKYTKGETTLLHGEAVGVGLAFALYLSRKFAGLSASDHDQLIATLQDMGGLLSAKELATRLGKSLGDHVLEDELLQFVAQDKKNATAATTQSAWILLKAPGEVMRSKRGLWTVNMSADDIRAAWKEFATDLR